MCESQRRADKKSNGNEKMKHGHVLPNEQRLYAIFFNSTGSVVQMQRQSGHSV